MSAFDERKKAFEAKFQHDQEMLFKITNRRNRLLGLWAAELMNIRGSDADAYAREVIAADFERPDHEDVVEKVMADFRSHDVEFSDRRLRKKMDELMTVAHDQIMAEE